jgi:DNA-binding beta-propeller fold protein YncE
MGTIDVGGAPEEAATDDKGHIYVDVEDKDNVAMIDAKTMTVTAHYDLAGKGGGPGGLALDAKNHILFAACHNPAVMVILNANDGKIITTLPIEAGTDGAGFNPNTMEAYSSQGNGTLTVIKESSPTSFAVEQTVQTMPGARTMTVDTKTNHVLTMSFEYGPTPPPSAAPAPPAGATGRGRGRGPARGPQLPDSFTIVEVGTK